jgi:DNA-binding LacI/PurR family transcriptional regulator
LLAEYLAGKGHRHALYRADFGEHTSTIRRQQAFLERADSLGIKVEVMCGEKNGKLRPHEIDILRAPQDVRPSVIVSWVDSHAYVLLEELQMLGIRVPGDIAVVGFDGIRLTPRPFCSLTSIRAPWDEVAITAVDLLMTLIEGGKVEQETMLPVELVVGDTA